MSFYPNGEPITKSRIQEEPWFPNYQTMMEMAARNTFETSGDLLRVFEADFTEVFGRPITPEDHVQFERWAIEQHGVSEKWEKICNSTGKT